jgi:hypothetical protein
MSRIAGLDRQIRNDASRAADYLPRDFHRNISDRFYSHQDLADAQRAVRAAYMNRDGYGYQAASRLASEIGYAIDFQSRRDTALETRGDVRNRQYEQGFGRERFYDDPGYGRGFNRPSYLDRSYDYDRGYDRHDRAHSGIERVSRGLMGAAILLGAFDR